jgi:endoglucanase
MLFTSLASIVALATVASAKIFYAGVAVSSGEFGVYSQTKQKGFGLPGQFGKDYQFIDQKGIDTYVDQNKVEKFQKQLIKEMLITSCR